MKELAVVALGGAVGSALRFMSARAVHAWLGRDFPWGTLVVNVTGSLVMGFLYAWLIERLGAGPLWRGGLLVGLLGGYTTFSAFSIETFQLIEQGEWAVAFINVTLSVMLCVTAVWVGLLLGRHMG